MRVYIKRRCLHAYSYAWKRLIFIHDWVHENSQIRYKIQFLEFVIFSLFHLVERVLLKSTVQYKFVRNQNIHHIINRKTLAISLKIEQVHIRGL